MYQQRNRTWSERIVDGFVVLCFVALVAAGVVTFGGWIVGLVSIP